MSLKRSLIIHTHLTQEHLEDEILGPRIIDELIKVSTEKKNSDSYMILLLGYARSHLRDFESYFWIVVGLDREDIQSILKQYISHFITYGLTPGIYKIQDFSDTVHTFAGHNEIIKIEFDNISMKIKISLKHISGKVFVLRTLRFDERFFSYFIRFYTILRL